MQLSAAEVVDDVNMEALHTVRITAAIFFTASALAPSVRYLRDPVLCLHGILQIEAMRLFKTVYDQPLVNAVSQAKSDVCATLTAIANAAGAALPLLSAAGKNPFGCNCASLLPGTPLPLPLPRNDSLHPASKLYWSYFSRCAAVPRAGGYHKVLFVQQEFLYCACLASHLPLDPSGFCRVALLFLLSYWSHRRCDNQHAEAGSESVSRGSLGGASCGGGRSALAPNPAARVELSYLPLDELMYVHVAQLCPCLHVLDQVRFDNC